MANPPGIINLTLTDLLREGARELLAAAVSAEVAEFFLPTKTFWTMKVNNALYATAFCPSLTIRREVMTGIGEVPVKVPGVGDRAEAEDGNKLRFSSFLVPPYLRKTKSVEELLPWLYLKGFFTGDFSQALAALLGLPSSTITRLKARWWEEYQNWRNLSGPNRLPEVINGVEFKDRIKQNQIAA